MTSERFYVGFDLGTTNSSVSVFDGKEVHLVRSAMGGNVTPSVVRISAKGGRSVGAKARRFLDRDPENTKSAFKRLMGTEQTLSFPASGIEQKPQELSAEVLKALCADVEQQFGFSVKRAVVTVPALFEIPQSAATAEAGRLAGLEKVELLQEPVASALASGWKAEEANGHWLVYDLGGGTFDVSLLETRDGLLRVIGHSGDNFFGGRDLDNAIVDWAITQLQAQEGCVLERKNPKHQAAIYRLALAAEETKIELTRMQSAALSLAGPLEVDGEEYEVELDLSRDMLEQFCLPMVERSIQICQELLVEHGLQTSDLGQVVLVGGPTVMPLIRREVQEKLGNITDKSLDSMTLVAQGAALFASTANLENQLASARKEEPGHKFWLQYPTMSSDTMPYVIGRMVEPLAGEERPFQVQLKRSDGEWESNVCELDEEDAFVTTVSLLPHQSNTFVLEAKSEDGEIIRCRPKTFNMIHGLSIGEPPLARTIGVALANNGVRVYFMRGIPLPTRRTFVHHSVETVLPGSSGSALRIPIVQGEFEQAHLCRLVGTLEIKGSELHQTLPMGTPIEVTLELDRGGHLKASATIPSIQRMFEEVAQLLVPSCSPDVLSSELSRLRERLEALQGEGFRLGIPKIITRLEQLSIRLDRVEDASLAARGGDEDAGQKARRNLIQVEAELDESESIKKWPELDEKAERDVSSSLHWCSLYGTPIEKKLLNDAIQKVEKARADRSVQELQRYLRMIANLRSASYYRAPDVWKWEFEYVCSSIHQCRNLPLAKELQSKGEAALGSGDTDRLREIVNELWGLLPEDEKQRAKSFHSGVR